MDIIPTTTAPVRSSHSPTVCVHVQVFITTEVDAMNKSIGTKK
jgi:hypothetical protein